MNKTGEYNKIDEYIDSIYKNFDCGDRETKTLKEEMRDHLYEEVEELKRQSFSEEQSIEKALDSFGQENNVVNEMNNVLKSRNIFTKMLIKAGSAVFVIGCLFLSIGIFCKGNNVQYLGNTSQVVVNQIFYQIENNDSIDESTKHEIDNMLDDFNNTNNNGLYYIEIKKSNILKYEYKKQVSKDIVQRGNEGVIKETNWSINYKKTDAQQVKDLDNLNKVQGFDNNLILNGLKNISYLLFIISLAILDIAFYYHYFSKDKGVVLLGFIICDCVVCLPLYLAFTIFPHHIKETLAFILGTTFMITLLLRIFFIKSKKIKE